MSGEEIEQFKDVFKDVSQQRREYWGVINYLRGGGRMVDLVKRREAINRGQEAAQAAFEGWVKTADASVTFDPQMWETAVSLVVVKG